MKGSISMMFFTEVFNNTWNELEILYESQVKSNSQTREYFKKYWSTTMPLNSLSEEIFCGTIGKDLEDPEAILRLLKSLDTKADFKAFSTKLKKRKQRDITQDWGAPSLLDSQTFSSLISSAIQFEPIKLPTEAICTLENLDKLESTPGIYAIVYAPTGQAYIGKADNLKNRIAEHISHSQIKDNHLTKKDSYFLHRFIYKIKKIKNTLKDFNVYVLEKPTIEQLGNREMQLIKDYNTFEDPIHLNLNPGGTTPTTSKLIEKPDFGEQVLKFLLNYDKYDLFTTGTDKDYEEAAAYFTKNFGYEISATTLSRYDRCFTYNSDVIDVTVFRGENMLATQAAFEILSTRSILTKEENNKFNNIIAKNLAFTKTGRRLAGQKDGSRAGVKLYPVLYKEIKNNIDAFFDGDPTDILFTDVQTIDKTKQKEGTVKWGSKLRFSKEECKFLIDNKYKISRAAYKT
jgi:hypothetical protein